MDYMSTPQHPAGGGNPRGAEAPLLHRISAMRRKFHRRVCARDQPWRWSPAARARHASLAVAIDHPEIISNERDTPEVHHVG